ncbi:hypothetical protein TYRP_008257 [Tyrophagus putrescentiae]|nr:hypothetical protein TYRP_008257 [Tyrophagus putrescentiae]
METPLRSVRKKAFSILDSTSFPDAATNTKSQLHHINITPINFDRTSNPHRMHTFHEASPERIETLINNNNTDEVSGTLTSSGIDSLADRVASLLGKPANFDPFETPNAKQTDSDDSKTIQKSVPLQDEDSSLQLLSKSIMNATHFNTSTNFVVPALATHDIRSPLQTLPFDQNNNNENNSSSSSDISNNPISFSSSSIRDYHSDREESKQTSEEVPYQRPPLTLPPRLSTIIEASKSTDSISRNSGSIMLEADRLLETINRLLSNKSRSQNQSTIDSLRKAASVQSAHSLSIPEQPSEKGDSTRKSSQASPNVNTEPDAICIEASDAETEYLEPPVEPPNARPMLSQTYNSHIYTSNKRKGKTATTASATAAASERQPRLAPNKRTTEQTTPPDSVATTANTRPFIKPPPPAVHRTTVSSSSSSSSSYQPKRTILEEKDNCLSQIQKGTDDLRRLHLELMQFESDYGNKNASTAAAATSHAHSRPGLQASVACKASASAPSTTASPSSFFEQTTGKWCHAGTARNRCKSTQPYRAGGGGGGGEENCCHQDHCFTRQKSSSCKSSLSNVNKSVQTSFLIDTADEQLMVANHCRPKTPSSIRASGSTHRSNNGSAGGGGRSPLTESSNGLSCTSTANHQQ